MTLTVLDWRFFLRLRHESCCTLEILTFVAHQEHNRLNIRFLVGFLHHAEPVLQIFKTLVVGNVIHQENTLQ